MKQGIKKTVAACCIALMLLSGCTKSAGTESADTKDTVSDLTEQVENYTIKAGTSETTVTMDSLIYGAGKSMGR